ncbi:MAG: AMP-binding protein [Fusobacterium sp.]|uniref:AMP-binding protein n=1 Tax=Fusobacterium sp. TaxID=68766 RepID=UPI0026DD1159|nr:AMP-binding protein [Fusobacterium sp.]MDO4689962.1 AMP-binding protein [Fusobacterium sp.]
MSIRFLYDRQKTAVIYNEDRYTYSDVIRYVKFFSNKLEIEEEAKVAVMLENRPETIFSLFSIWDKKAISINLDASYTDEQLAYVFNDAEPEYIFVSNKTEDIAKKAMELSKHQVKLINVDEVKIPDNFKVDTETVDVEDLKATALILYTSGTTGNPKGVMLSFENIMANINGVKNVNLVTDNDTILAILPYHHILPLSFTLIMPIYFGVPIVILGEISSASLKKNLKEHKISVIVGVPRVWEMLDKAIMGEINKSSLGRFFFKLAKKFKSMKIRKLIFSKVHNEFGGNIRVMASGGAKLDAGVIENFLTLGFHLIQGYGMTETAPIISFNVPGRERADTVGEIIPDVEVKFTSDDEILVRGKNVTKGYYKNEIATKEAFDEELWFHTGDLGKMSGNHLVIIGRKKEMIVLPNGKNINPSDIEGEIIKETDLIKEVAITEHNNHLIAVVYPDFELIKVKKIVNISEAIKWEVIDKYNLNAPNYKKIHDIKIVKDELPKTKMGKIRRFMLKDLLENKVEASKDKNEKEITIPEKIRLEYELVSKYIEDTYQKKINPDSHIELDLGFDSLDMVELMNFINSNFSTNFAEEDFVENKTIETILTRAIEKAETALIKENENLKKVFENSDKVKLPASAFISKIFSFILRPIYKLYFGLSIKGKENIKEGAGIIAGNHQSFHDAFIVNQSFSSKELAENYYIATALHFKSNFKKYLANNGNIILVDVNRNLKTTLQAASKVLKSGKKLMIFPEGARTRTGDISEFKKTFAILAKELNVPVYPFVINGAYDSWPINQKFPKKGKLSVEFLERIEPNGKTVDKIVEETKNRIASKITKKKITE